MKKFVKSIGLLLLFAFACSALIVVPTVAETYVDTDDIIYVGEGAAHANLASLGMTKDSSGIADPYNGKTIVLVSDINEMAEQKAVQIVFSAGGNLTIDGRGHTITLYNSIIAKSTSGTANVTLRNVHLTLGRTNNVTAVSARANGNIVAENCYIDSSFQCSFALNASSPGTVTINSGMYEGSNCVIWTNYKFSAGTVDSNKIVINGGVFRIRSDKNAAGTANMDSLIKMGGNASVVINGGTFIYQATSHPVIAVYSQTSQKAKVTLGTFEVYTPAGFDENSFITQKSADLIDVDTTSANIKLYKTVNDGNGDGYLSSTPSANAIRPDGLTVSDETVATISFKDVMQATPVALAQFAASEMAQKQLNLIVLTADTDVAADLDYVVVDKNGHTAANLTGDLLRDGLDGAQVYVQYHKVSDTEAAARILVAYSAEYTEASVTLQGSKDPVVQNISKYFTSIQAGGKEVSAVELGGTKIFAIDIVGLTKAEFADASHKLDIDMYATDGVNASMGFFENLTIQLPDDVLASLS